MKRFLIYVMHTLLSIAFVIGGIYIETQLYNSGLKTFFILLYIMIVPPFVCTMMSRSHKRKKSDALGFVLFFTMFGAVLYWIAAGVASLILHMLDTDSTKCFYVIYVVLMYIYAPFSLMYGDKSIKNEDGSSSDYGPATTRLTWLFTIWIHLASRYLIKNPDSSHTLFWIIFAVFTLLIINFGPARGELLSLSDQCFRRIKKISSKCPNCQNSFELPIYICPDCGMQHSDLIPSEDGGKYTLCDCGKKLPTTFFNGREKLEAHCPYCGCNVKDGGKHVDICIPVIGGVNAGKTCLISQSIAEIGAKATKYGLDYEYSQTNLDTYPLDRSRMDHGQLPSKTGNMRLNYHQFYLTPKNRAVKNLISLCDVAGEVYSGGKELDGQIAYKYANAFLMIIDPLSIKDFRDELEKKTSRKYTHSAQTIEDISGRVIIMLENMFRISAKDELKTSVAVVFTKCDIPQLDEKLGGKAVSRRMNQDKISAFEAQNRVCEEFLNEYGETNFVNSMRSRFKTVQFFCTSALGHDADGTAFAPKNVDVPVLWLINEAGAKLNINATIEKNYL